MKLYRVGIYARLSTEDAVNSAKSKKVSPFQDESTSIENQKMILRKYAESNGWTVEKTYADDGYSGGNFQRPGFEAMLADAKSGAIDLILVKDLSRFGRDYVNVGYYTEDLFPSLNVRFIALMDGIDSENNIDILPFRSILNDYHLKDLSKKIKSVFRTKAQNGEYIGTWAPYGYNKNPANKYELVIDNEAAVIVRRIFEMRSDGLSNWAIAAALNKENILSPRTYFYSHTDIEYPVKAWTAAVIHRISQSETYIGNSVRLKTGSLSYKNRTTVNKSKDEWIRCENAFPPIVSRELWEKAQRIGEIKAPGDSTVKPNLFRGFIRCADCGGAMVLRKNSHTVRDGSKKTYRTYICSKHINSGYVACSRHTISEESLLAIIREDIRKQLEKVEIDQNKIIAEVQSSLKDNSLDEIRSRLKKLSARLGELENYGAKLYEDRLSGAVSLDTFKRLSAEAETESSEVQAERDRLIAIMEASEKKIADTDGWIEAMEKYLTLETIDRETLTELIERIEVGESGEYKRRSQNRTLSVKIFYRFSR